MNDLIRTLVKGFVPLIILLVIGFIVIGGTTAIVESGHVGVIRTFGAVQPVALKAGFHMKKPIMDQVEQMDVRLTGVHAQATAASKDLQTVTTQVTMQYSLNGDFAPQIYQTIGNLPKISAIIEPAIQECVKAVTAKFTAEELVTKRELVKQQIQEALVVFINKTLKEKNVDGALNIANVAITDFNFSEEFNKAIESKVKAEQQALQAKNEKIMRVTMAEASALEQTLAADAKAYTIEVESKSRADAIKRESEALKESPELVKLRAVEKWDGVLPRISSGGVVPFLNLGDAADQPSPKPGR